MATKTFKPGEVAYGGLIKVTTSANQIKVSFLDWNTKKEINSRTFPMKNSFKDLEWYVDENSTSYWSGVVCDWIKEKHPEFNNRHSFMKW